MRKRTAGDRLRGGVAPLLAGALLLGAIPARPAPKARPPAAARPAAPADDLAGHFAPGSVIVFQGDSITDGGRGRSADPNHVLGQDYAYLIAARCGAHDPDRRWTFYNRGVSGDTVPALAARWQADALALKPDILSVLVGVNDAGSVVNSHGTGGVPAAQYEQGYDQILAQARAANPDLKIVLCEPFIAPAGHVLQDPALWGAEVQKRQAAVERLAAKYHAPVVRFQDALDAAIRGSTQPVTYWVWDGIHPTYAGHEVMAEAWLRTVNQFYYRGLKP